MNQPILSEENIGMEKNSLALQQDRSAVVRKNIKRYYIYFVLALVVVLLASCSSGGGQFDIWRKGGLWF